MYRQLDRRSLSICADSSFILHTQASVPIVNGGPIMNTNLSGTGVLFTLRFTHPLADLFVPVLE